MREYHIEQIKTSFENCIDQFGYKNGLILITEALKRADIRVTSEAGETYLSVDSSVNGSVKSDQALEVTIYIFT